MPLDQLVSIEENSKVNSKYYQLTFCSLPLARGVEPGQFLMMQINPGLDPFLRRPFSYYRITGNRVEVLYEILGRGTALLSQMKKGAVIVDVAIDQGGSVATSRPTTHEDPIYLVDDIVHYCVTNMPGAVARTSTYALTNATFPFILELANKGFSKAVLESQALASALNIHEGVITIKEVAETFGLTWKKFPF